MSILIQCHFILVNLVFNSFLYVTDGLIYGQTDFLNYKIALLLKLIKKFDLLHIFHYFDNFQKELYKTLSKFIKTYLQEI